jgi:imidazole glycerol-phosphate synthase subunit HisF
MMLRTRVIPTLLLRHESLVKTVRFGKFTYVGDPCNTVCIFNELEVDELLFLDIAATREQRSPNLQVLADIANECFMPLAYGGGIRSLDDAKAVFDIGFEKIAINTYAVENPSFIEQLANIYGNQAIIASVDVKKSWLGHSQVKTHAGRQRTQYAPLEWAKTLENLGAGEILLTDMDREGTWTGFNLDLIKMISDAVDIPVIAHGGAGCVAHIGDAVQIGKASAVALGSMVVFQKEGMGVLVNFPDHNELKQVLY